MKTKRSKQATAEKKSRVVPYTYVRSETNLFQDIPYEISRVNSVTVVHHPVTSISDQSGPVEFQISHNDSQYVNLRSIRLLVKVKITKADGSALAATDVVSPCQNFAHSMFRSVQCWLNDCLITSSSENYPYRAYLDTLLGFGKDTKKTHAALALWDREKDLSNFDEKIDDGFKRRFDRISKSKTIELIARPFLDITNAAQYLPPGLSIRLNFSRSSAEFALMSKSKDSFKFEITDAKLQVEKLTLLPSIALEHIKTWESGEPVSMLLRRVELRSFTVSPGISSLANENLLTGLIPYRVIIGVLPSVNYVGSLDTNPFLFNNNNVSYINLCVNGEVIHTPLELDYANDFYAAAYDQMWRGLELENDDAGLDITLQQFKEGCCFYVYNIADCRDGYVPSRFGSVSLELKFKTALTQAMTVLAYIESPSVLQIDRYKNCSFLDFNNHS